MWNEVMFWPFVVHEVQQNLISNNFQTFPFRSVEFFLLAKEAGCFIRAMFSCSLFRGRLIDCRLSYWIVVYIKSMKVTINVGKIFLWTLSAYCAHLLFPRWSCFKIQFTVRWQIKLPKPIFLYYFWLLIWKMKLLCNYFVTHHTQLFT